MKNNYYFTETNEKDKIDRLYDVLETFYQSEQIDKDTMFDLLQQVIEEKYDTIENIIKGTKPLLCPNCRSAMYVSHINMEFDKAIYDKWVCDDCSHIIVLDWRDE